MRVTVEGVDYDGPTVDLRDADVSPERLLAAIRADEPLDGVRVICPTPNAAHDRLGYVSDASVDSLYGLLAAAARSRGIDAPQDELRKTVNERLAAIDPPSIDLMSARRRVADTGGTEARLREQVATLRGRLQSLRERDLETGTVEAELRDTAQRLSEVETERIAAEQALERIERAARDARTTRQKRLELQDRAANLDRAARRYLADAVYDRFAEAVHSLPVTATTGDRPADFEGGPVATRLAAAQIAVLDAPVVVDTELSEHDLGTTTVRDLTTFLDTPTIRL